MESCDYHAMADVLHFGRLELEIIGTVLTCGWKLGFRALLLLPHPDTPATLRRLDTVRFNVSGASSPLLPFQKRNRYKRKSRRCGWAGQLVLRESKTRGNASTSDMLADPRTAHGDPQNLHPRWAPRMTVTICCRVCPLRMISSRFIELHVPQRNL